MKAIPKESRGHECDPQGMSESLRAQADRSRGPERGSLSAQADRSHMTEGISRSLNTQADRSHMHMQIHHLPCP